MDTADLGLSSEFIDLFLAISTLDYHHIGATCNACQYYRITDHVTNRSAILTHKQLMREFYSYQLYYDVIPWSICLYCNHHICPSCVFDMISDSIASGMLTTSCITCQRQYSYMDIMGDEMYSDVFVQIVNSEQEQDPHDYEYYVRSKANDLEAECGICYVIRARVDELRCGHAFCRDCLQRSLEYKMQCPMCRQSVE